MDNTTDLLVSLMQKCKCSVTVTINQHKDYNQSIEEHISEMIETNQCDTEDISEVLADMIAKDTMIEIQFYPDTAVGFFNVFHHDLVTALQMANKVMDDRCEYPDEQTMLDTIQKAKELDGE